MKRLILALSILFLLCGSAFSATVYYRQALTGGGVTALDEEDGDNLVDGDMAIVQYSGDVYFYLLDDDGGAAESSPDVIVPDTNPGTKNWVLQNVYSVTSGVNPPAGTSIVGGVAGMVLSNDTAPDEDVNITAGACMDSTGIYHILAASQMTKQIDAAWAAGDDAGGLLNGSVAANELYHVYALRKDADGTADYGLLDQDDAIGTYLPAGYTYYRWIGFVETDADSDIRAFVHTAGDIITFTAAFEVLTNVTVANLTSQSLAPYIPAGKAIEVLAGGNDNGGGIYFGPNATEATHYVDTPAGAAWADILTNATHNTIWVSVTSAGAVYIDTDNASTDIWMKAVKIIR